MEFAMKSALLVLVTALFFCNNASATINNIDQLEKEIAKQKNPIAAGAMFNSIFRQKGQLMCPDGNFPSSQKLSDAEINVLQIWVKPEVKVKCFISNSYTGDFFDQTDECILARRNTKKSDTCWFNYQKYLPETSSIKTDQEFLNLADAISFFFTENGEEKYCANKKETTTTEKKQCVENIKKFINQLMSGKAPHCRDTHKNEYYSMLENGRDVLNRIKNASIVNRATGYEQQDSTLFFRAIYSDAFGKEIVNNIKNFGPAHFCRTDGFERDLDKINSQMKKNNTARQGQVIELN